MAAMSWATPTVNDAKNSTLPPSQIGRASLVGDVMRMATPQARDFRTEQRSRWEDPRRSRNLNDQIGGQLNPDWVEGLMGWPMNWTCVDRMSDLYFASWEMGFIDDLGAEAPENGVRGVRDGSAPPGAPRGPEEGKQLTGKHSDALPALPQLLARYGKKAWQDGSWENAIPRVAKNVADREDRLKAIGNGQVPLVAATAFQILSERLGKGGYPDAAV